MAFDLFGFRLIDATTAGSGVSAKVAVAGDGEPVPGLSTVTAKVETIPGGEPVPGLSALSTKAQVGGEPTPEGSAVSAKVLGEAGEPSPTLRAASHTAWISG